MCRINIPYQFTEPSGKINLIDNTHVETFLQYLAQLEYGTIDKQELEKFTSHSIQVGACVV